MPAGGLTDAPPPPSGWIAEALSAVRQLAGEAAELRQAGEGPLTEALAQFLTAQYVMAARAAVQHAGGGPLDLPALRALCADVVALRRGDQAAARLQLDRERFEEAVREHRAAAEAARKEESRPLGITPETMRKIEEELQLI